MDLVQLKIKSDSNTMKYVKLIRSFDKSLPLLLIKQRIDNYDFVVEFDLHYYDVVDEINEIDRKQIFRQLIDNLISAGAEVSIYHNNEPTTLTFIDNWLNTMDEIAKDVELDIQRELGEID